MPWKKSSHSSEATSTAFWLKNLLTRFELASVPKDVTATIPKQQKGNDPNQQDRIVKECEEFLRDSQRLRDPEALTTRGKTRTGRINSLASTKSALGVEKRKNGKDYSKTKGIKDSKKGNTKTEGIDLQEINRWKLAGECLHCAWPPDEKGTHRVKNCIRPIKLSLETANHRKANLPRIEEFEISSQESSEAEDSLNEE